MPMSGLWCTVYNVPWVAVGDILYTDVAKTNDIILEDL